MIGGVAIAAAAAIPSAPVPIELFDFYAFNGERWVGRMYGEPIPVFGSTNRDGLWSFTCRYAKTPPDH